MIRYRQGRLRFKSASVSGVPDVTDKSIAVNGTAGQHQLVRALGPGMAMAMVVGNVIGVGIFMKPSEVAESAGSFPVIIVAWFAGGLVCFLGALCLAELAVMLPRAGGLYVYLREAYGQATAFLFGWSEFVFGRPASIGALAVAIVAQIGRIGNWQPGPVSEVGLSLLLITLLAWINIRGVLWGGQTQAVTTLIKATVLGLLAAVPFMLMAGGAVGVQSANYHTTVTSDSTSLATQFAVALLAIMWAYNGWHAITPVAEEVRDPDRNIPRALLGGLAILVGLYIAANIAYHGVLTMQQVREAGITLPQRMIEELLSPYGRNVAHAGVTVISLAIMVSAFGAINTNMMNGPRVGFAMGRDRAFLLRLGDVHAVWRTPITAILTQTVMAGVLVIAASLLVNLNDSFRDQDIFRILTNYVVFAASVFLMLAVGAVIVLRIRHPEWKRPYRTPGYPFIPILYLLLNAWFLDQLYSDETARFQANVGVGLTLAGLPVYFSYQWWIGALGRRSSR